MLDEIIIMLVGALAVGGISYKVARDMDAPKKDKIMIISILCGSGVIIEIIKLIQLILTANRY